MRYFKVKFDCQPKSLLGFFNLKLFIYLGLFMFEMTMFLESVNIENWLFENELTFFIGLMNIIITYFLEKARRHIQEIYLLDTNCI